MPKRYGITCGLLASLLLFVAPFSYAQMDAKKKVATQSDLPRFSYPITRKPSDLLQAGDVTFNAFAAKVRADLEAILRDYEIADKSTMRTLLATKLYLQEIAGEYQPALETVDTIRAAQEKPSDKLTSGLFDHALLRAAIETKTASGAAFEQAFAKHYREEINALPWDVVQAGP
jgi:hypothetical protein